MKDRDISVTNVSTQLLKLVIINYGAMETPQHGIGPKKRKPPQKDFFEGFPFFLIIGNPKNLSFRGISRFLCSVSPVFKVGFWSYIFEGFPNIFDPFPHFLGPFPVKKFKISVF